MKTKFRFPPNLDLVTPWCIRATSFTAVARNQTADRWRRAMHLSFVAGWLTPEEACAIDYTTEELQDQSPRVQRLLGHRSYTPMPHPGGGLWLKDVRSIEDPL